MNIAVVGAHPDDAEVYAGGALLRWADAGFRVTAVSMTNGELGHHAISGAALAEIRRGEMQRAAGIGGYRTHMFDHRDGELTPSVECRKALTRLLRQCEAQVVVSHRPWDYHPDHRYTAQLVQDSVFMTTVPFFCGDTPPLETMPVCLYMMDHFTKPCPFQPDVALPVDALMDRKWALLDAMPSQFYAWLPWLDGSEDEVPAAPEARRDWLRGHFGPALERYAEQHRAVLKAQYGPDAQAIRFAEFFEICEYGRVPSPEDLGQIFPFLNQPAAATEA